MYSATATGRGVAPLGAPLASNASGSLEAQYARQTARRKPDTGTRMGWYVASEASRKLNTIRAP